MTMSAFTIRTLRPEDASQLLTFERDNRTWFERHVDPRPAGFYTHDGVRDHIRQFLDAHERGTLHPCLILDRDGQLVGRCNLKDIDQGIGTAEVGYRIAQHQVGQGLATAALEYLIGLARAQWRLARLCAYVAQANTASARVLERCGFSREARTENVSTVAGVAVDGHRFALSLKRDIIALRD